MAIASALRAELHRRRVAIQSSTLLLATRPETAWWKASIDHWWFACFTFGGVENDAVRDCIGALVLLSAVARVDYAACVAEMQELFPTKKLCGALPRSHDAAIGLSVNIDAPNDLGLIVSWMHDTPLTVMPLVIASELARELQRVSEIQLLLIPVRLCVLLPDDACNDFFRHLLHHISTQQSMIGRLTKELEEPTVLLKIVEIVWNAGSLSTIDEECLSYLSQLQDRGVRMRFLPVIVTPNDSADARRTVAQSFRVLMPHHEGASSVREVCASTVMSPHVIAPFFSAVQVSQSVKRVDILAKEASQQQPLDMRLWRWAAYALFSRHAQHHVETVIINDESLSPEAVSMMEQVLRAENPLGQVFDEPAANDLWLACSRFYMHCPDESASVRLDTQEPVTVRVINSLDSNGVWWKVLLPGHGAAWVRDEDATNDIQPSQAPISPINFWFSGLGPSNVVDALSFLRLVPQLVRGIEISSFGMNDDEFDATEDEVDMTEWVREVLQMCPNLERLELHQCLRIERLGIIVEGAVSGSLRLSSLDIQRVLDVDAINILDFLGVLSDMSHPFTKHLQNLALKVEVPPRRTSDFENAWKRLLLHNRQLHTISLFLFTEQDIDGGHEVVALRSGPLDIASKSAFLSVVDHPDAIAAARRLDASAITTIFAFAAPHRIREVKVECSKSAWWDD